MPRMDNNPLEISTSNHHQVLSTYSAGDPEHPNWYIYEYENHRKVLVEIDPKSGKIHFLRQL